MAIRKVTYFKCDTVSDLADCKTDNIVFVTETGKQYFHNGSEWVRTDEGAGGEAFPIGSIYVSVNSTNPATALGYGTWTAFGAGRTLVGLDSGQTEFDTVEETGGSKTHALTTAEMPSHTHLQDAHTHVQNAHSHSEQLQGGTTGANTGTNLMGSTATGGSLRTSAQATLTATAVNQNATATNQNTGGDGAHNNLQPYIVVYFWKRTA